MIKDFLYLIAMDQHGALVCSGSGTEESPLVIGGQLALGVNIEITEGMIMDHARFQAERIGGIAARAPERIGSFEHDNKTYHLFFVHVGNDMCLKGFTHRWWVEERLDYQTELSAKAWELLRDRPFTTRVVDAGAGEANRAPGAARRKGQLCALWGRIIPYANAHADEGVVIVVRDGMATLVDGDGSELKVPRPVNVDMLCPDATNAAQ